MQAAAHEYLTVHELADLLRIKERKVYDLAASGSLPCSRATGKLLFPADEIRAWIESAKSGSAPQQATRPDILLGSHDPLLDWAVRESRCGLATFYDGSQDGLDRFYAREGSLTGLHLFDAGTRSWNAPAVARQAADLDAVLVRFATRRRGLVLGPDIEPIKGLCDITGHRFAPRQPGSGTDVLFRHLAQDAGVSLEDIDMADVVRTEDEAVQSVCRGDAQITFGLEPVAALFNLRFVPVTDERFDLLIARKSYFEPAIQRLLTFFGSDKFRDRAGASGYDVSDIGRVVWNA